MGAIVSSNETPALYYTYAGLALFADAAEAAKLQVDIRRRYVYNANTRIL